MPTVQAVIDAILSEMGAAPLPETVDVVVAGDSGQEITGMVTTFLASYEVLQRAVEAGANLVISHETPFYNHHNRAGWLADDPVYEAKKRFIEANRLVIWRCHDYWHRRQPDGIQMGMLHALGWIDYCDPAAPMTVEVPTSRLDTLVAHIRSRLGSERIFTVGDGGQMCSKIALLVGARGAEWHIRALRDADVLIAGEVNEWETPEYVRDARALGLAKALIVTGHQASEEAGMAYLAAWLRERLPDVPVTHIPSGDPFR